jgi:acetyl esterase/lipase
MPPGLGLPLSANLFGLIFGNDPEVRKLASPVCHARRGLPPFLIFSAEKDLPTLPGMAAEFHQALLDHQCESTLVRVESRNHHSIIFKAVSVDDPVASEMLHFIRHHLSKSE